MTSNSEKAPFPTLAIIGALAGCVLTCVGLFADSEHAGIVVGTGLSITVGAVGAGVVAQRGAKK